MKVLIIHKISRETEEEALRKKENEKFEFEGVFYSKIKKKCFRFFSSYVIPIEIAFQDFFSDFSSQSFECRLIFFM